MSRGGDVVKVYYDDSFSVEPREDTDSSSAIVFSTGLGSETAKALSYLCDCIGMDIQAAGKIVKEESVKTIEEIFISRFSDKYKGFTEFYAFVETHGGGRQDETILAFLKTGAAERMIKEVNEKQGAHKPCDEKLIKVLKAALSIRERYLQCIKTIITSI